MDARREAAIGSHEQVAGHDGRFGVEHLECHRPAAAPRDDAGLSGALDPDRNPNGGVGEESDPGRIVGDRNHPPDQATLVDDRHAGGDAGFPALVDHPDLVELGHTHSQHLGGDRLELLRGLHGEDGLEFPQPYLTGIARLEASLEIGHFPAEPLILAPKPDEVRHPFGEVHEGTGDGSHDLLDRREDRLRPLSERPPDALAFGAEIEGGQHQGDHDEPDEERGRSVDPRPPPHQRLPIGPRSAPEPAMSTPGRWR